MTSRGRWFYLATASSVLSMSLEAAPMQASPVHATRSDETRTVAVHATRQAEPATTLKVQAGASRGTPGDAAKSDDTKALRRMLHLRDGRTLRVIARAEDGAWNIQQGASSIVIPFGAVESVRLEREVLAELTARRQRVAASDVVGRVALAEWMLDQGLLAEVLRETDALLAKSPDQEEVLAFLRTHSIPVAWPDGSAPTANASDDVRTLIDFAARSPASVRELALARLSTRVSTDALRELLARELSLSDSDHRMLGTVGLRRMFPGQEIAHLQERAVLDPAPEVRESAARSLCAARDASVTDRLCSNLAHPSSTVRVHATEALGRMGYAAAVEPLVSYLARAAAPSAGASQSGVSGWNIFIGRQIAYVQDYDVEVAQNAAIGRPLVNVATEGAVLDVRVLSTQTYSTARERGFACRALESLTHAGLGNDSSAWIAWWKAESEHRKDRERGVSTTEVGTSSDPELREVGKR